MLGVVMLNGVNVPAGRKSTVSALVEIKVPD